MSEFRVLSLDGGGIKGAFIASLLAECEAATGKRIAEHFDLITGTSTGGIIAIALGLGLTAGQVLDFYEYRGPRIFPATGVRGLRWTAAWRAARRPMYRPEVLRQSLLEVFGERLLGESRCRLVIPSYDAVAGDIHLFKTAHHPDFKQDFTLPAVDIAMATAAAPVFFPSYKASSGLNHLDGGIWANCPAMVGVVEAMSSLKRRPDEIDVLSVGTTAEPSYVSPTRRYGGWLTWNKGLVDLLIQAQVQGTVAQCTALTGRRILRLNPITRPGLFAMDDARQIPELISLGVREARRKLTEIDERYLYEQAEKFEPIYKLPRCGVVS